MGVAAGSGESGGGAARKLPGRERNDGSGGSRRTSRATCSGSGRSVQTSRATCSAMEAHSRLLGGFAGEFNPKGHTAPAFSQVSEVGAAQHPPRTTQKSEPMAKSGLISCRTAQKSQDTDADKAAKAISTPAQAQSAAP